MADPNFNSKRVVDVKSGFDQSKLKGKSVVVTGGASGLGEEMVRHFVKAGAYVTIGDLSEERAASIANDLGKDHCTYVKTDVTSWSSQLALFKHGLSHSPTGTLDYVVANAGISGQDAIWRNDLDSDASEPSEPDLSILNVNVIAVHYTAKLAAFYLSRNKSDDKALVMTASLAGYLDMPGAPQYGASKWGVRGLMHSLRRTMPDQGVRVNMIAPWFIRTPILSPDAQAFLSGKGVSFAEKADAAKAVLHLCADKSICGRTLAILPRAEWPEGYADLCLDDYDEGEVLTRLMDGAGNLRHRVEAK